MKIALTVLAAAAGIATASPIINTNLTNYSVDTAGVATGSIVLDVSGMNFNDAQGSGLNEILNVFLGVGGEVTGIAWDTNLTTVGGSWASEAVMSFGGVINLTVGFGDDFSVTNQNYASGEVDLSDNGLPNIGADGAGNMAIEFWENFVDNGGTGDSFFEAGSTVTLTGFGDGFVPTPGSLAVLGLGGLVAGRRRR